MKQLHDSKQRLAHVLSSNKRAELIHFTFSRLLDTLILVKAIDRVLVISDDQKVLTTAIQKGCLILREQRPFGLNTAVSEAIIHASRNRASTALILPADLPFIQPSDINHLLNAVTYDTIAIGNGNGRRPAIVFSSNEEGTGTNAMLLPLPTPFQFQYGKNSYQKHQKEATRLGFVVKTIEAPNLQFDLDTEADWRRYRKIMNCE